jgi:hypothetical protein
MKNLLWVICLILPTTSTNSAKTIQELRRLPNNAFDFGETLKYRIHYGFIDAGTATLKVLPQKKYKNGHLCFHIVADGRSVSAFDWFFKVRDHFETLVDRETLAPHTFYRNTDEGGYKIKQTVYFDQEKALAHSDTRNFIPIPQYAQDIISAFYYARTLDLSKLKINQHYKFPVFLDDQIYQVGFKYLGKEKISTDAGTFSALKIRPLLLTGRVFSEEEGMTLFVSDDERKIPIELEAEILVGSVKMSLVRN